MANTYVDYTATAAQQYFAFNFPYLEDEHVVVEIEGVDQTITTNYTIETSPTQRINLSNPTTALAGGELIRIKRRSAPNTNLVDFQNGSVLTEAELDRAYLHNRYLAEEATEGADSGLKELEGSTNFNANNKQIKNLADGTLATDAVNKGYVDTQIALSDTNLAGFYKSTHTGNAVDNVFTLSFTPQTTDAKAYIVSIDGLVQVPDTDYTIGATAITFNTIPSNSAEICVVATAAASVTTVNEAQVTALGTSDTRSLATWTRDLNSPTATGANEVTATGSTTARSLEDRFGDIVNVKDYGAVGDYNIATSTGTDDTTAVQAAVATGKSVYFPKGVYYLTNSLNVSSNTPIIYGESLEGTTLLFDDIDGIRIQNSNCSVQNLLIRNKAWSVSGGSASIGANTVGLHLGRNSCYVENVEVFGFEIGFLLSDIGGGCYYNTIQHSIAAYNKTGLKNVSAANFNRSYSCQYGGNYEKNIWVEGGSHDFYNITSEQCTEFDQDLTNYPNGGILIGESSVNSDLVDQKAKSIASFFSCYFEDINVYVNARTRFVDMKGTAWRAILNSPIDSSSMFLKASNNLCGEPWRATWSPIAGTINTSSSLLNSGKRYSVLTSNTGSGSTKYFFSEWNYGVRGIVLPTTATVDYQFQFGMWIRLSSSGGGFASDYPNILLQCEDTNGDLFYIEGFNRTQRIVSTQTDTWMYLGGITFHRTTFSTGVALNRIRMRLEVGDSTEDHSVTNRIVWVAEPEIRYLSNDGNAPLGDRRDYYELTDGAPVFTNTGSVLPSKGDGVGNLGNSGQRWDTIYATTGTINTSDLNDKQQIEDLSNVEKQVALELKSLIRKFKFNDAVELKGEDARIHVGVIAQDVERVFIDKGLNPSNYGLFCRDEYATVNGKLLLEKEPDGTWAEGSTVKTRLGVRYEELLAFVISAL